MSFHEAEWLTSAVLKEQWPQTDLSEIVFVGRSNAGKSSLINALVNRKQLAYVGKTPGKTKVLNFFLIDKKYIFTDAPGYGYAVSNSRSSLAFAKIMEPYFAMRNNLKAMLLVLDARRKPSNEDIQMVNYAKDNHLAIIVACTKKDKLSFSQLKKQQMMIANELALSATSFIAVDSLKKNGIDELWYKINSVVK